MYTVKMYKVKIAALKIWCQFKLKKKKSWQKDRECYFLRKIKKRQKNY